jgi:glycosyltransferase involved in cell wall biosynthesis
MPLVSVIIPVKNGVDFIEAAVSSVLRQTFRDFEIIVIDDQSHDGTRDVLEALDAPMMKIVETTGMGGLVSALNLGMAQSTAKFIARLDADDIALPTRLDKQVKLLEDSPATGMCGTWVRTFGSANRRIRYPTTSGEIKSRMLFSNPFAHPSVMIRRGALDNMSLAYDNDFPVAEDFRLWTELSQRWELANIPEELLRYRVHAGQVSERNATKRMQSVTKILEEQLSWAGVDVSPHELNLHSAISFNPFLLGQNIAILPRVRDWFHKLEGTIFTENYSTPQLMKRETTHQMRRLIRYGALAPVQQVRSKILRGRS